MKKQERQLEMFMFRGDCGSKRVTLETSPGRNQKLPEHSHDIELDPNIVDIVRHDDHIFRIYWNKRYFTSYEAFDELLKGDAIPALIVVGNYKPMVVRSEAIDRHDLGFVAYRWDGKAIVKGEATVYSDRFTFTFSSVYRNVRLNCCATVNGGGGARRTPGPKAGPPSGRSGPKK